MKIRQALSSDIDSIMQVEAAGFIPQIQEERSVFLKRIALCAQLFLVFEDEGSGRVGGYLCAEELSKLPTGASELALGHLPSESSSSSQKKIIYISSFSILPEFRGKGTGRDLWNKSLLYFKQRFGDATFVLLVNSVWAGAKHIYEDSGFVQTAVFRDFFPTLDSAAKTDGILMQLN